MAESASKGTRVIVTGRLKQQSYETHEGGWATVYELDATDVGISLQRTTAKPVRAERQSSANGGEPEQVCTRCGERHDRYGPNGRPCYTQVKAGEEPPNDPDPIPGARLASPEAGSATPGDLQATASSADVRAIRLVCGRVAGCVSPSS